MLIVPFREVRHDQPDECLHYEPISVRGREHNWTIPAHQHDGLHQYQLLVSGAARATIDGQQFNLRAPAVLMIAPGSVHGFVYAPESSGHQASIPSSTVRDALAGAAQLETHLSTSFVRALQVTEPEYSECEQLYTRLAREFADGAAARGPALMAHATLLTVWFLRQAPNRVDAGRRLAGANALLRRFERLIEDQFREHHGLAHYASLLKVTPDHLSRSCSRSTGLGALEILQSRRMLEARRMLSYTPFSIAQISAQLGYGDPAYFSKVFARTLGMSPSAYRESVHSGIRSVKPN